ncbi:Protein LNK1 [Bienertia sinuspersici]
MLDKSPQSHSSGGGFSASLDGDCNGKNSCSAPGGERSFDLCLKNSNMDPTGNGLCENDPLLEDRSVSLSNNLYQYELNNATHSESDLGFFGNNLGDKESNDLLYYGWTEIENFEDVDRMFRSCDSTFGLGIDSNDGLGWLSSSHTMEGSNDATKPSFDFSGCVTNGLDSLTEQQEVYELNNNGLVADDNAEKLTPVNCKRGSQKLTANGHCAVIDGSYVNGSCIDSESQILTHVSLPKHENLSEEKRKECPSENSVSFIQFDNLKQAAESNHSLNFQHSFSSENHQKKETSHGTCVQMPTPLVNSSNSHSSNEGVSSVSSSIIKSEDTGFPSISPRDSFASNPMQSMESNQDFILQNPSLSRNKKKNRPAQRRLSGPADRGNIMVERADTGTVSAKKLCDFDDEVEGQSEVDGDVGLGTELDSSNMQESSCMSSALDEIAIDASSFQQLQNVMEKLDIRTKLCIRDSLYRLARSAERRHNCVNPISGDKEDKDASGALLSDGTNKCTGFMDMETDTNPIDRSIAHLLFHRPSDLSAAAPFDNVPVKSHTMGQARKHGQIMAEKPSCQEETTSANGLQMLCSSLLVLPVSTKKQV